MCTCSLCTRTTNSSASTSCSIPNDYQVSWDNILYVPNWLTQENTIETHIQTLTTAEVLAWNSTPIEILPQPGTSKILDVISAYAFLDFNTTGYSNVIGNRLVLKYNGATDEIMGIPGTFVAAVADARAKFFPKESISNWVENAAVMATVLNANPTTGNSPITLFVNFRTMINA